MTIEKVNKIGSDQLYANTSILVIDKTQVESDDLTHFEGRIFIMGFDKIGNEEYCDIYDVTGVGDDKEVLEYSWKFDVMLPIEDEPGFQKWNHLVKDINRSKHIFLIGECGPSPIVINDVWKSLKIKNE